MKLSQNLLYKFAFFISVVGVLVFIADFGYSQSKSLQFALNAFYFVILFLGLFTTGLRYYKKRNLLKRQVYVFDFFSVLYTIGVIWLHFFKIYNHEMHEIFYNDNWLKFAVFLTFIREFAEIKIQYKRKVLNPAQLFIASFLAIILIGTFLLMLPGATYQGITFINALFTSTSAVCVTGLVVVDTGTYFTTFGQSVILLLIQIGGLGILTFASYFSYFFKGGSTYENQLVLSDMTSSQKLGEVFSTLKHILIITFSIEFFAAVLIFFSLKAEQFNTLGEKVFFAGFHAVSAFCNAGFSTLSNSIYDVGFRFNYSLQLVLIFTFVLGGLGFPIVVNILNYTKYYALSFFTNLNSKKMYKPWMLKLNSRITLITTISLSVVGFVAFYFLEYNNTLAEHNAFGKVVTALFGATTPRTAGFNTINMIDMRFSTTMLVFLLMWVGASPLSTGGGIKTSTFAIASLNILSLAKGKTRIEIYRREIADISVRRAFAIISLSLIVIGTGVIVLSISDSEKNLIGLAFECFSAYSTVGLSLNVTPLLSTAGKWIIIAIMFVGRVSMLSIIIAVFTKIKHKNYRYPSEEITMN